MQIATRIGLALVIGVIVGGGLMLYDKSRGAEWVVSPAQVAASRAAGEAGVATRPGTVAVRPIRSEIADILPYKWGLFGVVSGLATFVMTRPRRKPETV